MGGAKRGNRDHTNVLLEAATGIRVDPADRAQAWGSTPTPAYRFERGGDIEAPPDVLARAAQLMADLGGGTVARGVLERLSGPGAPPSHPPPGAHRAGRRGVPAAGGCRPHPAGAGLRGGRLGPTTCRWWCRASGATVHQEDDLVEEIVRIWGYDQTH